MTHRLEGAGGEEQRAQLLAEHSLCEQCWDEDKDRLYLQDRRLHFHVCDSRKDHGSLRASSAPWALHRLSWGTHMGAETAHEGQLGCITLVHNPFFC